MAETENKNELLNRAALDIYIHLAYGRYRSYDRDEVAAMAFSDANAFVREAQRIERGGKIRAQEKPQANPVVIVHLWDPVGNTPLFDETTGLPITAEVQGDYQSHCPNLDPRHPLNQRYFRSLQKLGMEVPARYRAAASDKLGA